MWQAGTYTYQPLQFGPSCLSSKSQTTFSKLICSLPNLICVYIVGSLLYVFVSVQLLKVQHENGGKWRVVSWCAFNLSSMQTKLLPASFFLSPSAQGEPCDLQKNIHFTKQSLWKGNRISLVSSLTAQVRQIPDCCLWFIGTHSTSWKSKWCKQQSLSVLTGFPCKMAANHRAGDSHPYSTSLHSRNVWVFHWCLNCQSLSSSDFLVCYCIIFLFPVRAF